MHMLMLVDAGKAAGCTESNTHPQAKSCQVWSYIDKFGAICAVPCVQHALQPLETTRSALVMFRPILYQPCHNEAAIFVGR